MLSFKQLTEKKTKILLNPKINDLKEGEKEEGKGHEGMEKSHGEDCDCMKCEKKRRKGKGGDPEVATESAVPGKPAERLGAVTAIPKDEREAALARIKAKTAAKQREKGMREDVEIEEGMTIDDFKKQRSRQKQKDKRAAEKTSSTRRAGIHNPSASPERAARHRANVDPDFEGNDERNYPGGQLKNPKKIRKAMATGELTTKKEQVSYDGQEEVSKEGNQSITEKETLLTFNDFQEARNAYAIGMAAAMKQTGDNPPLKKSTITKAHKIAKAINREEYELDEARRGPAAPGKEEKGAQAAVSLAAKRARQRVLDAHEKKTGNKLDIMKTPEGKSHAKNFPGSRQAPKVKGAKETPQETQNRRINASNARKVKHGFTSKEKKEAESMARHTSRYD